MASRLFDYEVRDPAGRRIGTVEAVWEDERTGATEFLGVRTTWLVGRIHLVPMEGARLDEAERAIHLRWTEDQVKEAPSFGASDNILPDEEARVYAHFGLGATARPLGSGAQPAGEGGEHHPGRPEHAGGHAHRAYRHDEHLRPGSWPPGP